MHPAAWLTLGTIDEYVHVQQMVIDEAAVSSAVRAAAKSARRTKRSTLRVLRTASWSMRATHSATALPPATAYGTPAPANARVALRKRSLTFSAAMSALSQPTA